MKRVKFNLFNRIFFSKYIILYYYFILFINIFFQGYKKTLIKKINLIKLN
jgi:hypothetical protein